MKTIVIPQFYRGPSGQKGLYNRQEVGLARAFAALGCRAVVLYPEPGAKAPRIETPEPNVKICYMPAVAFGVQAFYKSWQILLDEHADAVHVMGDNSLGVPGLYRFCQKHGILFYSQLGALKSTSTHAAVRRVMDLLLCRNLAVYRKTPTYAKTPAIAAELEKRNIRLSSANSINWGRLVPQIVYYFAAYAQLLKTGKITFGDEVDFCVPTGNFGDILAGYFARKMGLPVGRLICASNANDVLTEFLTTGRYDKRRPFYKTTSPSMDILVSSNLERLLYLVSQDASCVERLMRELNTQGWYQVSGWMLEQLRAVFGCGCCDDAGAAEVIGRVWREHKYLCDPHTAVAWAVAEKHTREGVPMVVLSTASPYKFPAAVLHALGEASGDDEFAMMEQLHALTGMDIPKNLRGLEGRPVLHTDVIDKDAMLDYVLSDVLK